MEMRGSERVHESSNSSNNYSAGVPSMSTGGSIYRVVTCGHYNVRNAPVHLPYLITSQPWGHFNPLVFTIICVPHE
jgi:hypothetical protein